MTHVGTRDDLQLTTTHPDLYIVLDIDYRDYVYCFGHQIAGMFTKFGSLAPNDMIQLNSIEFGGMVRYRHMHACGRNVGRFNLAV